MRPPWFLPDLQDSASAASTRVQSREQTPAPEPEPRSLSERLKSALREPWRDPEIQHAQPSVLHEPWLDPAIQQAQSSVQQEIQQPSKRKKKPFRPKPIREPRPVSLKPDILKKIKPRIMPRDRAPEPPEPTKEPREKRPKMQMIPINVDAIESKRGLRLRQISADALGNAIVLARVPRNVSGACLAEVRQGDTLEVRFPSGMASVRVQFVGRTGYVGPGKKLSAILLGIPLSDWRCLP